MIQMKHNKAKTPTCERKPIGWTQVWRFQCPAMLSRRRLVIKVKVSSQPCSLSLHFKFSKFLMKFYQKLSTKLKSEKVITINFYETLRK